MMTLDGLEFIIREIEFKLGVPPCMIRVTLEPGDGENMVAGAFIKTDENGTCPDLQDGAYLCVYSNGHPWDVTIYYPKTDECRTYDFSTRRGAEGVLHEDGTIEDVKGFWIDRRKAKGEGK